MSQHNKMWCIDDMDRDGNPGMTVLLARNKKEALEMFDKMYRGFLSVTEIEQCISVSLAMVSGIHGETSYRRRKEKSA